MDGRPIINRWRYQLEVPISTAQSDALAKDLKGRGFQFVGSTICYAYMQAAGLVMDHTTDCFRYPQLAQADGRRAEAELVERRPGQTE